MNQLQYSFLNYHHIRLIYHLHLQCKIHGFMFSSINHDYGAFIHLLHGYRCVFSVIYPLILKQYLTIYNYLMIDKLPPSLRNQLFLFCCISYHFSYVKQMEPKVVIIFYDLYLKYMPIFYLKYQFKVNQYAQNRKTDVIELLKLSIFILDSFLVIL